MNRKKIFPVIPWDCIPWVSSTFFFHWRCSDSVVHFCISKMDVAVFPSHWCWWPGIAWQLMAWQEEDTSRVLLNRLADFCMLSVLQMRCDSPSQIHPWALSPFAARLLSMDQGTSNVSFPMKLEVHDLASGVLRVKGWERSGLQYFRSLWGLLVFFK